jgi:5-formyltetrahydrofolate cyclo-ligase
MDACRISSLSELEALSKGKYGLVEPYADVPASEPSEIDLVVAPCFTADVHGTRLGHGGGYYDRYLKRLTDGTVTVALCREKLLAMNLPTGPNDMQVDFVATESGLFTCDNVGARAGLQAATL